MLDLIEYTKHFEHLSSPTMGGNNPNEPIGIEELLDVVEMTGAKRILEIGFNNGGGSLAFLMAPNEPIVTSIDINPSYQSGIYLSGEFFGRFFFKQMHSGNLVKVFSPNTLDLVYIDGDHSVSGCNSDIESALALKIPYILFDDTDHRGHPNIKQSVEDGTNKGTWEVMKVYTNNTGRTLVKVI